MPFTFVVQEELVEFVELRSAEPQDGAGVFAVRVEHRHTERVPGERGVPGSHGHRHFCDPVRGCRIDVVHVSDGHVQFVGFETPGNSEPSGVLGGWYEGDHSVSHDFS